MTAGATLWMLTAPRMTVPFRPGGREQEQVRRISSERNLSVTLPDFFYAVFQGRRPLSVKARRHERLIHTLQLLFGRTSIEVIQ